MSHLLHTPENPSQKPLTFNLSHLTNYLWQCRKEVVSFEYAKNPWENGDGRWEKCGRIPFRSG